MRRMPIFLCLVVATAGCASSTPSGTDPPAPFDPQGSWRLISGMIDGEPVPLVDGYRITLNIDGTTVGGTSACNAYGGRVGIDGNEVTVGELAGTEMACERQAMDSETAYLSAIVRIEEGVMDGSNLVLTGAGVDLTFSALEPVPAEDLIGTVWVLEALIEGDTSSSPGGEAATLELNPDGTASGSTGCRLFTGSYQLVGDEVVFTELRMDGSNCPPDVARQDGTVVEVLGDGFTVEIDGAGLTLRSAGNVGLGYRSE